MAEGVHLSFLKSAKRKDAATACIAFCVFSCVVGFLFILAGIATDHEVSLLATNGIPLSATVTALHPSGKSPSIDYRFFDSKGNPHENRDFYSNFPWNNVKVNDAVSVIYLADNPSINMLLGRLHMLQRDDIGNIRLSIMAAPFLLAGIFFGLFRFLKNQPTPKD